MTKLRPAVFVAVALSFVMACGSSGTSPTACTPGQSVACTGAGGCSGGQVCLSDGSGFAACVCGSMDGGVEAGSDAATDSSVSYTTGKACTSDAQCTGPGEKCSSDAFGADAINRSPICVSLGCTPSPSAPTCNADTGACVNTNGGTAVCSGKCTFDTSSGAAPTGCAGSNVCRFAGTVGSGPVTGIGACIGGCTADNQCSAGKCQVDTGECVASVVIRTKKVGDACTFGDTTCNCPKPTTGTASMCTDFCTVGASCATGFSCDPGLPVVTFTKAPAGMAGMCLKNCTTQTDCLVGTCTTAPGVTAKVCRL